MSVFLSNLTTRLNPIDRTAGDRILGSVMAFPDEKKDGRLYYRVSGMHVICRMVKNNSGGTLARGKMVKYKSTAIFREIGGLAGAGEVADGVVDPYGPAATIADGEHFLIVIAGRVVGLKSASETYSQGDLIKTGASGVCTASAAITTAGFCGKVEVATTSNGDDVEAILQLRESINLGNLM